MTLSSLLQRLLAGPEGSAALSYDEARSLARHEDVRIRRALAERTDVVPEILYYLAEDADASVRRAIADNCATPAKADLLLCEDDDPEVRAALARKIAVLAPGLSDREQARIGELTRRALAQLARDEIPRVRVILAEALKDIADAPPEVINRLARDVEIAVAAPVLAFSPVLTDADLLEIIHQRPATDRLTAIARRAGLKTVVTDALAATDNVEAITQLLANHSAQIREETLDALIDRGREIRDWHDPLIRRPTLHAEAARRLALFVADTLLEALMQRQDLPPDAVQAVAETVHERLRRPAHAVVDFGPNWREALREAHAVNDLRLTEEGLGEPDVLAAVEADEPLVAFARLGLLAGISPFAVAAAFDSASGKAMAAMAWKAGLSPRAGLDLQIRLGGLSPDEAIGPAEDGTHRLTDAEMDWQVELFCRAEAMRTADL